MNRPRWTPLEHAVFGATVFTLSLLITIQWGFYG